MNLKKYLDKYRLNCILLIIFTFNCVFIPYDTFRLKLISLALLLCFNIKDVFSPKETDEWITFIFGFLLTSINIILSICITKGNYYTNLQLGYVPSILLLYTIIKRNKIPYEKILIPFLIALTYLIVVTVVLDILGIIPFYSNKLMLWYYYSGNGMVGKGTNFVLGYMMFIKTTPMLIILIPYLVNKRYYLNALLCCIALILSGTRANMLIGAAVFIFCMIYNLYKKYPKKIFFKYFIAFVVILVIGAAILNVPHIIIQIFMKKAHNDTVRSTILTSIIDTWKSNPFKFITGAGYSSKFFNTARGEYSTIVELSYWNLLRQVGIVSFIFIMVMFITPLIYFIKSKQNINYVIAYLGYLIGAYTNPLLFTTTGITVLLFMYYMCFLYYKNDEIINDWKLLKKLKNKRNEGRI